MDCIVRGVWPASWVPCRVKCKCKGYFILMSSRGCVERACLPVCPSVYRLSSACLLSLALSRSPSMMSRAGGEGCAVSGQ